MGIEGPADTPAAGEMHGEQILAVHVTADSGGLAISEASTSGDGMRNGQRKRSSEAHDGLGDDDIERGEVRGDGVPKGDSRHALAADTNDKDPKSRSQQKPGKQQNAKKARPHVTRHETQDTEDGHGQFHSESIRASRFTLWETKTRFYLVSYNTAQTRFRILKVDRTPEGHHQHQQQQEQEQQKQKQAASSAEHTTGKDERDHRSTPESVRILAKESNGGPPAAGPKSVSAETASTKSAQTQPPRPPPLTSADYWGLNVTADQAVYDRNQITELLDMISEGNRTTGGLKEVGHFFGLIGFIRFTSTYYMVLISRRSVVALLGGHYIYHCDETKILPVCHPAFMASISGRTKVMEHEEARLLHTFKQVDLGKNFYFSYTYDLTRTLQENLTGCGRGQSHPQRPADAKHMAWGYCEKFIWNHHLLLPAFRDIERTSPDSEDSVHSRDWILPLCYGFVDQAKLSVMSRTVHVTLIARRSRHFAGARFLKRGADEGGHVANDVETEQVVSEGLTTAFYAPADTADDHASPGVSQNPRFTSYVMHRGSIPIFWTQDSTNMSPRPPIEISVVDPYFSAAAIHFDDMLARYGSPVIILNLIKSQEKTPRESKLLNAFTECVHYLNQFLPPDKKMVYVAWDMSQASKSREQDVIETLEEMAAEILEQTHFFHSGPEPTRFEFDYRKDGVDAQDGPSARREDILLQTGVARVNCVDCLDRTNAAQFVIGKAAFGHQLHAMGLIDSPYVGFDSDATDMLTEMYHDLGDTIALQYGGSHLVNTMETYRKINQWTSHSRDMLEGLKRYYANSFVDADKQAAINLFLGITRDTGESTSASTALSTHSARTRRRSYRDWYTADHLETISPTSQRRERLERVIAEQSSFFWAEYYRPRLFTDLMRHHAFKMTAVHQHQPAGLITNGGHAASGSSGSVHFPSPGASGIASGYQGAMPSSPSKKSMTNQQKERLRRESISSLAAPSSPSSPTLGRLAMGAGVAVGGGLSRTRTTSFGSSSNAVPLVSHGGSGSGSTLAGSGPYSGTHQTRPTDAAILVTSPFMSRVTGRRDSYSSDTRTRHRRRPSNGSEVGLATSGSSKFQPRLRTISGSSTVSTATTTTASGGLQLRSTAGPPPNYTVDEYGTHVHEPTQTMPFAASNEVESGKASDGKGHGKGNTQDSRALMGGVRRWMTLNHGTGGRRVVSVNGEAAGGRHEQGLPSSVRSNWLGKREASTTIAAASATESGGDGKTAPSDWTGASGAPAPTSNAIGGWNNPFPVQGAAPAVTGQQGGSAQQAQRVTAESLLSDWSNPTVDASEAQEYASWVSQFAGNIRLESSLPEYDALLAASPSGEDADQIVLDSTHSLSPFDLKLYIQSVKRATRSQMSAGTMSGDGVSQTATVTATTVDPVAALYTNLSASYAYQPGIKGVSEVKLRAFRNWLNIGLAGR